ncbi:hypothetical protein TNCV_4790261 [Trichonephila clavipes]|nr:hypothetical protein TNCV_4790261 [Trichonephila clavipes]
MQGIPNFWNKLYEKVRNITGIQICTKQPMVGNIFVQCKVVLFTRASKETYLHYRNHLSCHTPQRSMKRFMNTELVDMHNGLWIGRRKSNHERYQRTDAEDHRIFINLHHNLYEYVSLRIRYSENET